jgi:hypothetical protein
MNRLQDSDSSTIHSYESLNYVATDADEKDRSQSRRIHEPGQMMNSIDPITGNDIGDPQGHPFLVDGNLVIYFESEQTRKEYLDTPIDHPVRLPDNPDEDWVAEG